MSGIKLSRLYRHLPGALALVTAIVATIWLGLSINAEYESELRLGERQTQLLATGLQDTTERHFNQITSEIIAIHRLLEQHLRGSPSRPPTREDILRTIDDDADILRISIRIDGVPMPDISLADPEFPVVDIAAIARSSSEIAFPFGTVNIGAPVQLPGVNVLPLRFVFPAANGVDHVEIMALTDAEQVLANYESLDLATGSDLTLFRADGMLVAQWPRETSRVGQVFRGETFGHRLKLAPSGTFRTVVAFDNTERIVSYRAVDRWPFVIVTSIQIRGLLEGWWARLPAKLLLLACLLSAIFLMWMVIRSSQSALRQSVAQLTASEGRLARLLTNVPGGVFTRRFIPPDHFDYTFVSPGLLEIFGLSAADLSSGLEALLQRMPPQDRERIKASMIASISGDDVWSDEARLLRPDGQMIWVQARARRYQSDAGEILWDGIVTDITDLRRHEALLDQVQKVAGIGYWLWYPSDGNIKAVHNQRYAVYSAAYAEVTGVSLDELNISDEEFVHRYVHPEDQARAFDNYRRFLEGDRISLEAEYRIIRPDGLVRWFHETINKETVDGKITVIVGVTKDVTELKAREAELLQAQKMEAIGQLTGGVAHDFNNLLAVAIGNLEMILDQLPKDAPLAELAEAALSAADRGATLTKRLLAFARRQPLSPQPTDLHSLLTNLMPLLRRSVGELIDVTLTAEPNLSRAMVDPHQLDNAIINLANNARDSMPRGGRLSIHVDETQLKEDGNPDATDVEVGGMRFLRVTVADTGIGMTPDVLQRAADPFFTTKPVGQGTGLGLSMVYGLIKQSKGQIHIYSEPGMGTTVRMYLPTATDGAASADAPRAELADFTGRRALLVDDDAGVRATTAAMLRSLGFQVTEAADGKDALAVLDAATPFDVMVTDVMMAGGMLGSELATRARAARPALKVLFISGFASDMLADARPLLSKPFRRAKLAQELATLLEA